MIYVLYAVLWFLSGFVFALPATMVSNKSAGRTTLTVGDLGLVLIFSLMSGPLVGAASIFLMFDTLKDKPLIK
jgi:hypothetical protein